MKRCQQCNFENTDSMNFCLECGTPLGNPFQNQQPTVSYPNVTPTNPSNTQETQTVVANFNQSPETQTVVSSQKPGTPHFQAPPRPPKSNSKTFLIIGGILALLVLGGIAVVGIGIVALYSQNNPTPTPTPTVVPTRTVERKTPTPARSATPNATPTVSQGTEPSADYEDMWVEFNIKEGGQLGIRAHVSFTAKNMKGIESYLAIHLQKNDTTPIYGKMPGFRAKDGQVAVFKLLKPEYDPAEYKDVQLFIPYTAFGLPRGKYDLQMNVNLIYKTDGLIQHLNLYDFEFEQK